MSFPASVKMETTHLSLCRKDTDHGLIKKWDDSHELFSCILGRPFIDAKLKSCASCVTCLTLFSFFWWII